MSHNIEDLKGNKKQKVHLQERPLLVPGRKFGIKAVIWTNVSGRKEAGSQTQLREDALVQFLKLYIGLTDQLLLFFMDQQVSSSVCKEERNCSGRRDWNIRI